jgi:hypothetical protein
MMKPDFEKMTRAELKAYMLENRSDDEAFHAYIDLFTSTPTEIYSGGPEEVERLVKRKVEELKTQKLL